MIVPAEIVAVTTCVHCNSINAIELYDASGKPMNYGLMIAMNNYKSIDTTRDHISYFKCRHCGIKYNIWWNDNIPTPLYTPTRINNFVYNYISGQ